MYTAAFLANLKTEYNPCSTAGKSWGYCGLIGFQSNWCPVCDNDLFRLLSCDTSIVVGLPLHNSQDKWINPSNKGLSYSKLNQETRVVMLLDLSYWCDFGFCVPHIACRATAIITNGVKLFHLERQNAEYYHHYKQKLLSSLGLTGLEIGNSTFKSKNKGSRYFWH